MNEVIAFLARYELWVDGLLGVVALACLHIFWAAYQRLERTPFGLEKDSARRSQNRALLILFVALALGSSLFVFNRYVVPGLKRASATPLPDARPTVIPSPTPIQSSAPVVVDSSGCENPEISLAKPTSGERISGPYEIVGTANIPNFAFYKVEISGAATSGAWVTLAVGNVPKRNETLGSFDSSPYLEGEYAFRLVVTDNVGNSAPPCVIAVTLAGGGAPAPVAP